MTETASVDDPTIPNEADLWRRVHPMWVVPDDNRGEYRLTSQAFQNLEGDNLSVLLEQIVRETRRSAAGVLEDFPGYCLAAVTAGQARVLEQKVV